MESVFVVTADSPPERSVARSKSPSAGTERSKCSRAAKMTSAVQLFAFSLAVLLRTGSADGTDLRLESNELVGPDFASSNFRQESGQKIRLRRSTISTAIGEGRVEVYYGGRWGLVCDNFFDLTGAGVICKQLGFSRGAREAKGKSAFGVPDLSVFNVDNLVCTGSETDIFQCRRSTQSNCSPATESAGVRCKLNYPSRCDQGGVLFDRSCYYFNRDSTKTFAAADSECRASGGALAIIESQEENDFVSEALFALYGSGQWSWFIGGQRDTRNRWKWQTDATLSPTLYSKWMPGITANATQDCLVLRQNLDNPSLKDYYFWDAAPCGTRLPYICERAPKDISCIEANGRDYQGAANTTAKGLSCWKWNDPRVLSAGPIFPDQPRWSHNYCRNPDQDSKPWCIVSARSFDYCDIPDCARVQAGDSVQLCEADQIRCGDVPKCVTKDFVCDYEQDCPNGFDEQNCTDWLSNFDKFAGKRLMSRIAEIWTYIPHPQGCAKRCMEARTVQCRSFSYVASEQSCLLGAQIRSQGAILAPSAAADFYELKAPVVTTPTPVVQKSCGQNEFTCNNRRCISGSAVCDGVDTCGDNSDERNCSRSASCPQSFFRCRSGPCVEYSWICDGDDDCGDGSDEVAAQCSSPVEVRLVNGTSKYSGRIEVKYSGVWGTVCSDRFSANDARVICRMMGRNVSAVLFAPGYFGPGTGPVWLDDFTCSGQENSVKDCKIKKWGHSDCTHDEDAGISCPAPSTPTTTAAPASSGVCGRRFVDAAARDPRKPLRARVVGGFGTVPGAFPWTAAVRIKPTRHHCGATVISDMHLLTAAHCFEEDRDINLYEVVVGDWDNRAVDGTEQYFQIATVQIYPNFQNILKDDLAVIKLKPGKNGKGIQFTDSVQPVCLPERDTAYKDGTKCIISGWGSMGVQYPSTLQAALLPMLSYEKCSNPEVYDKLLSPRAFCAGFLSGGIDSCQGDSGGPFSCLINGKFTIMGVISWGDGCAEKNKPGVYTKVAEYVQWIKDQTRL